jgi:anti-sigma factor RsiW
MKCDRELIARYVGGDVAAEEAVAIQQHLRSCADCAELARGLEEDRAWLASRPPETAGVDFSAMRREIRREIARPRWGWRWLAVAAAIVLAAGVGMSVRHRDRRAEARPTQHLAALEVGRAPARQALTPPKKAIRHMIRKPLQLVREEPDSPVEIRIATRDPSVTIILVHETKGVTQ